MRGWPTHRLKLRVSGHRLSRATGTVFLLGILVGAVAPLLTGSRPTADTTPDAQRSTWRSSTESAIRGSNTNSEPTASREPEARGRQTAPRQLGVRQRRCWHARSRIAVRSPPRRPTIGPTNRPYGEAPFPNLRSEAVSGASSLVAARNRSGSASLWIVRNVKRY